MCLKFRAMIRVLRSLRVLRGTMLQSVNWVNESDIEIKNVSVTQQIDEWNRKKTNGASDFISDALNVCLFAKTEEQITRVWLFNRIIQAWCVVTTLHRSHVWPALMVSCHPVETAAAVAATLTGPLLSNWWIILLLIWPPKAGNAKASSLCVEARTVLLYPFKK